MWESIMKVIRKITRKQEQTVNSKDAAKERLHLVLMQDRANVSADFLELMKQEIIEVIKKYIDVDENAIDVRLTKTTTTTRLWQPSPKSRALPCCPSLPSLKKRSPKWIPMMPPCSWKIWVSPSAVWTA